VQAHRGLEDVLLIDGNHQRRRPQLARPQRDRSADQSEPDDADLVEDRRLSGRTLIGLNDGECFCHG
jgi:hypothetical protein